jgi:uncharacterized protein (TIGR02391 family)
MNFCVNCCALTPAYKEIISELFERSKTASELDEAKRQFLKGEYSSAARTATIILENYLRDEVGDDSIFGQDLAAKAFSFDYNQQSKSMTKEPLIKLNDLDTRTKRNEQDGMRFLCMGLMTGCRNVFAHSCGHALPADCLSILMMCSFMITQIKFRSLSEQLKKRKENNSV